MYKYFLLLLIGLISHHVFSQTITVGIGNYLMVCSDSTVWGSGKNDYGQLGNGNAYLQVNPVKATGLTGVIAIQTKRYFSLALKKDGTVWAWGRNNYGQLGNGTINSSYIPQKVTGLSKIVKISASMMHSLAIDKDGNVWAWGSNNNGQLGDNTDTLRMIPVKINSIQNVIDVSAGTDYSLAVTSDGSVWAWGLSFKGNTSLGYNTKIPVKINLSRVKAVSAQTWHSLALDEDGNIWSWGDNVSGELGDGTYVNRSAPAKISNFPDNIAIVAGHQFSLCVRKDGSVWGWGLNSGGQLGNDYLWDTNIPIKIANLNNIVQVDAYDESIVLDNNRNIWQWGGVFRDTIKKVLTNCNPMTGIKEQGFVTNTLIYPNPSSGIFYLNAELRSFDRSTIKIYNVMGKVIYEENFSGALSNKQINCSSFENGLYFLELKTSAGKEVKKIIIQK